MPAATTASTVTIAAMVMLNLERLERPCWASEASLVAVAEAAEEGEASWRTAEALALAEEMDFETDDVATEAVTEAAETTEDADDDFAIDCVLFDCPEAYFRRAKRFSQFSEDRG
jgi:hypothetical protein